MYRGGQSQLGDDLLPGNSAAGRQLLGQLQAADVPALDIIEQGDQLRVFGRRQLLRLPFGLQLVISLPGSFWQSVLELRQNEKLPTSWTQLCLKWLRSRNLLSEPR